ncbi:Sua5/YciO/YrdC/YwlC family protein [Patescibacteria group bacterium]|nr:Sua5/YciO/YrdC/YwlC family protein [Patescibacteria group bacterium]
MKIIDLNTFIKNKEFYKKQILQGAIFIYPTDTIYGIGCNAYDKAAVSKIQTLKNRNEKPFSIIAPSKKWIIENFNFNNSDESFLNKLPGKYTLILNKKNISNFTPPVGTESSVGVRLPKGAISEFAKYCNIPIVTTSVNIAGSPFLTNPTQILENKKFSNFKKVDFIIDRGEINNSPSTLIDLTGIEPIYISRK